MATTLTVVPAYGRDYRSAKAAVEDWDNGKDFAIPGGPYINNADAVNYGPQQQLKEVRIRYDKQRKVVVVKIPPSKKPDNLTMVNG